MLRIVGSPQTLCSGLSRRNFLHVGAISGLGLSLPQLRRLQRATAAEASAGAARPKSALLIYLAGGPSHFETFDPKPRAPVEIRGPYGPISTRVPGLAFCETLPQLAAIADKFSLIRSCCHENSGHGGGERHVQTGYASASPETELPHDFPAVGSIVSKMRGPVQRGMPTYIHVPNGGDGGAKFLGNAYEAFEVYSTGRPVGLELAPQVKLDRLSDRRELRRALDRMSQSIELRDKSRALDSLEQQAHEIISSTAVREAFDLERESTAVRQRYGDHEMGRCCLLARRFIEAGAGLVSVRLGSWDHHGNAGGTVTSGTEANCPPLDRALSALIVDLFERGLIEHTVLWCWGEFGRTPRINNSAGRDHWPQAMSVLMTGGGIRPGRVIGATNNNGEHPIDRALSPEDVLATVYEQLGIDPRTRHTNSAGQPVPILNRGAPIRELL